MDARDALAADLHALIERYRLDPETPPLRRGLSRDDLSLLLGRPLADSEWDTAKKFDGEPLIDLLNWLAAVQRSGRWTPHESSGSLM